jgi:hypothetical protein
VAGSLPDGLRLDSFSGEFRGISRRTGVYAITVRDRDYDVKNAGASPKPRLRIADR